MKNVVNVRNNELLANLTYNNISLIDLIKRNILEDYSSGIKYCNLKIFPSDFYNINNIIVKEWGNGDILNVDDIVRILDQNGKDILYYNGDETKPYHFKVIDISTIYEGQPLLEIKFIECKLV